MTPIEALRRYFGYDSFRGGQEELIENSLSGRDVLGIMPTGAGKSMCYQIPAVLSDGITLVVSPLISLMKDQVGALRQSGISAAYINSTLTPRQMDMALYNAKVGMYTLIYVAPERLLTPEFLNFAKSVDISMLTVDEAHCISRWGQDFRPSYAQIPTFIDALPKRPAISAYTATATMQVREDIVRLLSLDDPMVHVSGFDRPNLYFSVVNGGDKRGKLLSFLREGENSTGIVYCSTRKTVEDVCDMLKQNGFSASRYHAGLSDSERHQNQDDFLYDRVDVMVATNAFGMGIDKSNVRFVVHYNMPRDVESYYQEAGRAGRDGSPARCLLLYSGQDVRTQQWLIDNARDTVYEDEQTERILKEREHARLRDMTFYSTTNNCLRGYILKYFGEKPDSFCGSCGNCDTNFDTVDVTEEAQKILSCIKRMGERFGVSVVVDVLRGSKNEKVLSFGFDKLSTYGISDKSAAVLRSIIDHLLHEGYLQKTDGTFPIIRLTPSSADVLFGRQSVVMKLAREKPPAAPKRAKDSGVSEERRPLLESLRQLRAKLAKEQNVPPYFVFSDKSLIDMTEKLPITQTMFLRVSGVGERKAAQYGENFVSEIADFCEENGIVPKVLEEKRTEQPAKKKKTPKQKPPLKLPDPELLSDIPTLEENVPVSVLSKHINDTLEDYAGDITAVSAVKIGSWLVQKGYLKVEESEMGSTKVPTELGLQSGITPERREGKVSDYYVNLYTPAMQRVIIDGVREVLIAYTDGKAD